MIRWLRWWYGFGAVVVMATYAADIWREIDYQLAADVSLICIAVFSTAFTIRYAFWSKWWTSRIGKVFLVKSVILSLFLIQAAVSVWWPGDYPGRGMIRFAIYSLGSTAFAAMLATLVREQRRDRERRGDVS